MRTVSKQIVLLLALLLAFSIDSIRGGESEWPDAFISYSPNELNQQDPVASDTAKSRYPISKTGIQRYDDLRLKSPLDLRTPSNIRQVVEYDPKNNLYVFRTKIGDRELGTPFTLTPREYLKYIERTSRQNYFYNRSSSSETEKENEVDFRNMQLNIGAAERIFGPGGVKIQTQGSAEISMGAKRNSTNNPSLPENARTKTYFDFNEKVQLNVNAKVGEKMNFGMNYDTEATFDFDSKKLKLAYEGNEDEILKVLEAGNVSMQTSSSLIRGTQALFGIKAGIQLGKFKAMAIVAQQESESRSLDMRGGAQLTPFDLRIDQYDENRHFFLSHYFYENYDRWMSKLPYISSGIIISRVEVWVTNKRGNYDQARDVVAFMDMGEISNERLQNTHWQISPSVKVPANDGNSLYGEINRDYPDARIMNMVNSTLEPLETLYGIKGGEDYEKVENARRLEPSEYRVNTQLGYVSLNSMLQPDEVLAVAFEYKYNGQTYQVGEFSTDNTEQVSNNTLFLKLLKGAVYTPQLKNWRLMMKNVYSLNAYQVQSDRFKLDIKYQSDTIGTYLNYFSEGLLKDSIILRVMNLDRLDSKQEPYPDGFFDFVDGYTIYSQNGKIIFPVVEPFGEHLERRFRDKRISDKYVFKELYDSTLTVARQITEKNKFRLVGEYKSSSGSDIRLGSMNVPRGSVRVTAGGMLLTENVDYTVDYSMGVVTILNQSLLESRTPISVSTENQSNYSMQRKTLLGLDLQYEFSKNFNVFGTVMHLSEKPLTTKVSIGNEPFSNTIWGVGLSYKTESQWLTNLIDKVPTITAVEPSRLSVQAEIANLIPGHPSELSQSGTSYIDDFETTKTSMDLRTPYAWFLSSVPYDPMRINKPSEVGTGFEKPFELTDRSLISWYRIDPIFTRNMPQTPAHIRQDKEQLSNHLVREVLERELFPNREATYGQTAMLPVMNISYYPTERGPYNLDVKGTGPDGRLMNPKQRFGGMMRRIDNTDFEAANYEYIEFWLMDPFVYDSTDVRAGGDLYFNLGEISEDILKDGRKFFENGMPIDGDNTMVETTYWGKVPKKQSLVYAFDNTPGARKFQDVGLNGLRTEEELGFGTYVEFVEALKTKIIPDTLQKMREDPFSVLNDPASDNFRYFRSSIWDREETPILQRYKRFAGVEGNSTASEDSPESYDVSARNLPDVEDINQDNTLNEYERYYEYKVSLRKKDMAVGRNNIVDIRHATVRLADGSEGNVKWYQFKVPIRDYDKSVGNIRDFKTIRFMRMYMTNFEKETHLRFGTLELVRGDWRTYTQALNDPNVQPISNASIDVSAVNIEENGSRVPVNYVLPPGISRMIDPSQPQIRQQNEQSLQMKVTSLAPKDARAVYKNTYIDMRQYNNIQMFVHAEKLIDDTELEDGDCHLFIRLGTDYKNNFYEYEIPLSLTPHGPPPYNGNSDADRLKVWPKENMFDVALTVFTDLKMKRNADKRGGKHESFAKPYFEPDPKKPSNKVTIVGNPSLAEVKTIMVGVRNGSGTPKSIIVWINELRMTSFNEEGGWAGKANINLALSDIGTINVSGQFETVGFGGLEQRVQQRRMDDFTQYNIATSVDLGRLLPEKVGLKAPFFYSWSEQTNTPKYNPLDKDILMAEALAELSGPEKDSLRNIAQDKNTVKSITFSNVKFDIKSRNPMPYDPANVTFGYSFSENFVRNPNTEYEITQHYRGNINYSYSPVIKPFQPFVNLRSLSKNSRFIKEFSINYLPTNVSFSTNMSRYYYEQQLRDYVGGEVKNDIPLAVRKDFMWERQFSLVWNLSKSLRFDINTGTNARIDEPNVAVNKRLFPDEYEMWKDSVWNNILSFGRPMNYVQTANMSYDLPLSLFIFTDWINAGVKYNSSYNWDRGAMVEDVYVGNIIRNQGAWQYNGRFNLESLYNKSKFLREANQRFASRPTTQVVRRNSDGSMQRPSVVRAVPKRQFQRMVRLSTDSVTMLVHGLDNKKLFVRGRKVVGSDTTSYSVKFKVKGSNAIEILNRDSVDLLVNIIQGTRPEEMPMYKTAQYASRFMMMLRNVNVSYRITNSSFIPYFIPEVADAFGQQSYSGATAPGWDYAFGLTDESYLKKALDRNWLISNDSLVNPASFSRMDEIQITATIEPIAGMRIDLNANRVFNNTNQIQFMFEDMPTIRGGNFTMTTVALASKFEVSNASNNYASKAFDRLINNRDVIVGRLENKYQNTTYPDKGFIRQTTWGGQKYSRIAGRVNPNSPDVLIPAFISAYMGKSPETVDLTAFPSLLSLLPNWRITYNGFMTVPFIRRYFKRFELFHAYRCTYSVGAFSSYMNWVDASQDGMGFIRDVLTGNPTPSSPYDISAASITESFAPLLGIDATLNNNITMRAEYRDTRNVSMNVSSNQIVEAKSNDFTVGTGYKIVNFKGFFMNPISKSQSSFTTDLTFRADLTYSLKGAYIRKLLTGLSEPISGNSSFIIKLSADYMLSRSISLRAFYDKQIFTPLVSSSSFPTSNSNFGVSIKYMLTR